MLILTLKGVLNNWYVAKSARWGYAIGMKKKIQLSLTVVVLILVSLACSRVEMPAPEATQFIQTESPTEAPLLPSETPSATAETPAVGGSGTPLVLEHLWMMDAKTGWALSRLGGTLHVLRTTDGALTWQDTHLPYDAGVDPGSVLLAAGFAGLESGWVAPYNTALPPLAEQVVWHTSDGGASWQAVSIPVDGLSEAFSISHLQFIDETNGWLMAHVGAGMNHDYLAIFRTQDGGSSWQRIIDPYADSSGVMSCQKNALYFMDAQTGWLTGSCNGVAAGALFFRTLDGGVTWERYYLPDPPEQAGILTDFDAVCATQYPSRAGDTFYVEVECKRMSMPYDQPLAWVYTSADRGADWQIRSVPVGALTVVPDGGLLILDDWPGIEQTDGDTINMVGVPVRDIQFQTPTFGWSLSEDGAMVNNTQNEWGSWWNITPVLILP